MTKNSHILLGTSVESIRNRGVRGSVNLIILRTSNLVQMRLIYKPTKRMRRKNLQGDLEFELKKNEFDLFNYEF